MLLKEQEKWLGMGDEDFHLVLLTVRSNSIEGLICLVLKTMCLLLDGLKSLLRRLMS